ncbi:MAG: VWA domain-containing protein [Chlorobi bacterium]|nr:VWA domain-containing protein [Chlorobiota bacterium]
MGIPFPVTAVLLLAAAALLAAWMYPPRRQPVLFLLRTAGLFFVFLFLWNPLQERIRTRTVKSRLVLLVDQSLSVEPYAQVRDSMVRELRADKSLADRFEFSALYFADSVRSHPWPSPGPLTDIHAALEAARQSATRERPTVVLLLSDGVYTKGPDYAERPSRWLPARIYPLVLGDTARRPTLRIERVVFNETVGAGNKFTIEASVSALHIAVPLRARLEISERGQILARKELTFTPSRNFARVRFTFTARKPGWHTYVLRLIPTEGRAEAAREEIRFRVTDRRIHILIWPGKIHPDAGALRRILSRNKQFRVEVERHPDLRKKYDLVIAVQPQADQIRTLADRRMPVWWITGVHTDWQAVNAASLPFSRRTHGRLTEEYFPEPVPSFDLFELPPFPSFPLPPLKDKFGDLQTASGHAPLLMSRVKNRPTGDPLWTLWPDRKQALLAGQGLWRWVVTSRKEGNDEFVRQAVEKTAAYLAAGASREQLEIRFRPSYREGEDIRLTVTARNPLMEPDPSARLQFILTSPDGSRRDMPLYFQDGRFIARPGALPPGEYAFIVRYPAYGLERRGTFTVTPVPPEQPAPPDTVRLAAVASATGGELRYFSDFQALRTRLARDPSLAPVLKSSKTASPLLSRTLWLWLAVVVWASEWIYRKRTGRI